MTTLSQVGNVVRAERKSVEETRELIAKVEGKSSREVERILEAKEPDVVRLELFVSKELAAELKRLQIAEGEMSLEGLLSKLVQKFRVKEVPTAPEVRSGHKVGTNPDSRYVPKAVKRELLKRDDARCTFEAEDGTRCESRRVEIDHVFPFMLGGPTSIENLRLFCHSHNQLEARRVYGEKKILRESG